MIEGANSEIQINFKNFKKNWYKVALILIILFGFSLRLYHADYPVVGYHNWKETHYLTESRNFADEGFFENGFFIPSVDFPHLTGSYSNANGAHTDPFPISSILVSILFMLFGASLFLARFMMILLGVGVILLMALIVKKLFKRKDLSLVVAFVTALNPLFVFFGRQVQDINPAMFLGLLSIFTYLRWRENKKIKLLILTAIFMSFSIMAKYSFALFAVPIFFTFPFKKLKVKKYMKQAFFAIFAFLIPLFSWISYSKVKSVELDTKIAASYYDLSKVFDSGFWNIMKSYVADNYTMIGILFAFIGLLLFFYLYKNKFSYNFILWYFVGSIPWFVVMADKMSGHNYHQYPIAPLVIFFISYGFLAIATNLAKFFKKKNIKWVALFILAIILVSPSYDSKDRMFDTQFIGLDIAGNYIKGHSSEGERILFPGHQSYGILWHADRMGFAEIPSEENIKFGEEEREVNWIFLYQWGLSTMNEPQWEYISDNYNLEQFAFQINSDGSSNLVYLLLKKGGTFDINELNTLLQDQSKIQTKEYEFSKGKVPLMYYSIN
jgi:MFS family permease